MKPISKHRDPRAPPGSVSTYGLRAHVAVMMEPLTEITAGYGKSDMGFGDWTYVVKLESATQVDLAKIHTLKTKESSHSFWYRSTN